MAIDLSQEIIRLAIYDTKAVVSLRTLAPGVYTQRMLTQGNSLLSTVFVESVDVGASVAARYYDYSTGGDVGEVYELATHPVINTALGTSRITVPRLHDKPVIELTVTGGNVRVGVYVTVVASFVTDLDQALQLDGSDADLLTEKGLPAMLYDEDQGKFFFLRGEGGTIPVSISEAGDPVHLFAPAITTPGSPQDVITSIVPIGKTRKLNQVIVVCRQHGFFYVTANGAIIGSGRTGPANPQAIFPWAPRRSVLAGQTLKVVFTALAGTAASDVEAYLMGSDV